MTALVETFPDRLRELNRGVTVYMDVPGVRSEDLAIELQKLGMENIGTPTLIGPAN
ncbi:hypothetical protein [Candidatus Solirubrobacter pratensis]|uniref:hypothetical protein n=1 Tax=Candidatus Solirubrobacter pratensis TaxID=1298857 RepID=UPI000403DED1|nr:hypothetical protein [Candidatus Solirubrobacter pratensis]